MSEIKVIWQKPGTEPFASLYWTSESPAILTIMAGLDAKRYVYGVQTLFVEPDMLASDGGMLSGWTQFLVRIATPRIKTMLEAIRNG